MSNKMVSSICLSKSKEGEESSSRKWDLRNSAILSKRWVQVLRFVKAQRERLLVMIVISKIASGDRSNESPGVWA